MNIVLLEPEIPQNTGSIGRLAVGTRSSLYLVGKLGFSIENKDVRRAGLDYWKDLILFRLENLDEILDRVSNQHLFFFSKRARKSYIQPTYPVHSFLIFGNESVGLPRSLIKKYEDRFFKIPLLGPVRSINLANAVSIVLYEALRQQGKLNGNTSAPRETE
jgi:tRNA (cytidine/uridine-2'-O-)-methyltransferase